MIDYESFPPKVHDLIRTHAPLVLVFPDLERTDEVLRQRRSHFGEYMLFADAIVELGGRIVLMQQRPIPYAEPGFWKFPGGGVGREEEIADAVVREVKEETGLDVEVLAPLGIVKTGRVAPFEGRMDAFLVTFDATAIGGELQPHDAEEVAALKLATVEEIEQFIAQGIFSGRDPYWRAGDTDCFRRWVAGRGLV